MSNKAEIVYLLTKEVIDLLKKKQAVLIISAVIGQIDAREGHS